MNEKRYTTLEISYMIHTFTSYWLSDLTVFGKNIHPIIMIKCLQNKRAGSYRTASEDPNEAHENYLEGLQYSTSNASPNALRNVEINSS
jgi:hypothetical protein